MKPIDWDAYRIFLSVARHGGLKAATAATGLSTATIGRRMLDFERDMECALFDRSHSGYSLTAEGAALFEQLEDLEGAARKVDRWRQDHRGAASVRISAGTWVGTFLIERFHTIRTNQDEFFVDLHISEQRADLSHRRSDIGVRAFEPTEINLAAIYVSEVAYGSYGARGRTFDTDSIMVAVRDDAAISPYLMWPHHHCAERIATTANTAWALRELVAVGAGIGVLPCFVGDSDPRLCRVGEEISDLRHRQWIVMHDEDRHLTEIRTVVDRITQLLKANAGLFSGNG